MKEFTYRVFDEIDKLSDKYASVLLDICNIESKTEDKEGVDKVGLYLKSLAEELGYTIKKKEFEKAGDVYSFTYNPGGEKAFAALSGHMDTVFPKGLFGCPPAKIEGDYIYGPGVQDCKGGIAIYMLVMEALKNCGFTDRPVKLILQSDEEVSSNLSQRGTIDFMVEEAKGSAFFINGEGHSKGNVTVGRKGIVKKKITIKGKAVHAGSCTSGINAIKEAAYKVIELEKDNDEKTITFNCGIISGGTAINTVAEECELQIEYRFRTLEQQKEAEEKFNRIVNTSYVEGTEATAEELSCRAPFERTELDEKFADTINSIIKQFGFEELSMVEIPGGSDAAYTALAQIPTVCSMGIEGSGCHSVREKAFLPSISKVAKMVASVIINFPD